jgi:hypothetical protein
MSFNPRAVLVLVGFSALVALALSSNGGGWFYPAEAVTTVLIILGLSGRPAGTRIR